MRICLYSDNHFCKNSSIIRSRGERFSKRLENQIKSIEWVEELAKSHGAQSIFCLGDFFDKDTLDAEEITALQEIRWNEIQKVFIAGNHEMRGVENSSSLIFNLVSQATVLLEPIKYTLGNTELCILPYILESNRKEIKDYFGPIPQGMKRVILSHNDIAGIQMGAFLSKEGFSLNDIDENCDLFINGHIHNCGWVSEKAFNIGNLTGQNFSEDAFRFEHVAVILDTDTLHMDWYENPHAFNFYKIDYTTADIHIINETDFKMKNNAVLTIKCTEKDSEYIRARYVPGCDRPGFPHNCLVSECRVIVQPSFDKLVSKQDVKELNSINHVDKFIEYCFENMENTKILKEELSEVCL